MLGSGKPITRCVAVSKEIEFELGKLHCSGINGGNCNGINAGAGGRRSTGYMEVRNGRDHIGHDTTGHFFLPN